MRIAELNDRQDLQLVTDSQDSAHVKQFLAQQDQEYDSFFVKVENGDYTEVYGFMGIIPELNKSCWKII